MAAGDVYELVIKGTALSQAVYNVFHFRAEGAGDLSQTIFNDWVAGCKAAWIAAFSNSYSILTVKCQQVDPLGPVGVEAAPAAPLTGTIASACLDLASSACIKWTTGYVGRNRRGRSFLGPLPATGISASQVTGGTLVNLQAYVTAHLAAFGVGGTYGASERAVVYSKAAAAGKYGAPSYSIGLPGSVSAYILAGVVGLPVRAQRRRHLGVGA